MERRVTKHIREDNDMIWKEVFKTAQTPIDVRIRDFQYRFLHDILVNNYWLFKWRLGRASDEHRG